MKLLPIPLSPLNGPPLGMWSSDLLWRYPAAPPSPLSELKTQLPPQLSSDPRMWGRDEVIAFLRWTEREFDLPKFELDLFQMNGKALCLLTKNDLAERCPGAGDIIHNVLQLLIRDSQMVQRHLPSSPITPTNRYPLSPHSHPSTPNWGSLGVTENPFYMNHLQHFMNSNSVTLSPAPSTDSQAGSPPGQQESSVLFSANCNRDERTSSNESKEMTSNETTRNTEMQAGTSSGSSQHSDSEDDNAGKHKHKIPKLLPPPIHHKAQSSSFYQNSHHQSPPVTPQLSTHSLQHQIQNGIDFKSSNIFFNSSMDTVNLPNTSGSSSCPSPSTPTTPSYMSVKREFFADTPEPNTSKKNNLKNTCLFN
jgi:ETS translocation variant 6/7